MSEILFILDEDEVYTKMDIRFYKEYMALVTEVEIDRTNKHLINNLTKAANEIRNWLKENATADKYSVEENREDTTGGYIHTIEIRENHYY
jgi:hypothetical protein